MAVNWQRARSPEQKAERIDAILDAAALLFDDRTFEAISMADVADAAGLAKASVYGYFQTKEDVFLRLFQREVDRWASALEARVATLASPVTTDELGAAVAATSLEHVRLCRLAVLLHSILDGSANRDARCDCLEYLLGPLDRFVDALLSAGTGLTREQAMTFLMQHHALVVGLWPLGHPDPELQEAFDGDPRLRVFQVDFDSVFSRSLQAILRGLSETP